MFQKNVFIHHVYFWLKDPGNQESHHQLVAGLKKLSAASTIRAFHIGKPAGTSRDVIENTYNVSWLVLFDGNEDQDTYQTDPIHLNFVEECSHLWTKVVVFDTVDI